MPEPVDAEDIVGGDLLWRRIDRNMVAREIGGTWSIQSWAYKDQHHELSVYLGRETTEANVLAAGKPNQIVIVVAAGIIRDLGYKIVRDPEPDDRSHCLVFPYPRKKADRQAMAAASTPLKDPTI